MAWQIWHELDHPKHSFTPVETDEVLRNAQLSHERAAGLDRASFILSLREQTEAVEQAQSPTGLTPINFIGIALGIRARVYDLDVSHEDGDGFSFSSRGIDKIRQAKGDATQLMTAIPDVPFQDLVADWLKIARSLDAAADAAEPLVGRSAGVRNFHLSVGGNG